MEHSSGRTDARTPALELIELVPHGWEFPTGLGNEGQRDEAGRVEDRESSKKDGLNHGEHRDRHPDADPEDERRGDREGRASAERTNR